MITKEEFYGRSRDWPDLIPASISMKPGIERLHVFHPTTPGSYKILLPVAQVIREGGPIFYFVNDGTQSIDIKENSDSSVLATIASGEAAKVVLVSNDIDTYGTDGDWEFIVATFQ